MGLKEEKALQLQVAQLVQQVSDSQATIASLSLQVGELLQELRAAKGLGSVAQTKPVNESLRLGSVKTQVQKLNSTTAASSTLAPSAAKKVTNSRSASKVQPAQVAPAQTPTTRLAKSTATATQFELNDSNGISPARFPLKKP